MPHPSPRVSVVLCTYNRAFWLGQAVESVLAQTCADFELLVVDDGSTDTTAELEKRWDDRRIRWFGAPHRGLQVARNFGVRHARGEWITFLDDDDEWRATLLEHQLSLAAQHPDAGVVYCAAESIRDDGSSAGTWPREPLPPPAGVFRAVTSGWYVWLSTSLIRTELIRSGGGFAEELGNYEDIDLWMQLALRTRFVGCTDALMVHRDHRGDRLSTNRPLTARSMVVMDRRWRQEIVAQCGFRDYAGWFHDAVGAFTVRALVAVPPEARRAEVLAALVRLLPRLPWSATTLSYPVVMLVAGPSGYDRLLRAYRRLRALRSARRGRPPRSR